MKEISFHHTFFLPQIIKSMKVNFTDVEGWLWFCMPTAKWIIFMATKPLLPQSYTMAQPFIKHTFYLDHSSFRESRRCINSQLNSSIIFHLHINIHFLKNGCFRVEIDMLCCDCPNHREVCSKIQVSNLKSTSQCITYSKPNYEAAYCYLILNKQKHQRSREKNQWWGPLLSQVWGKSEKHQPCAGPRHMEWGDQFLS